MAADHPTTAAAPGPDWFAAALNTPAVQHLRRRVESGGVLSLCGTPASAQPFLAAALRQLFPERPIVVVTEGLKTQEVFHQDVETWLKLASSAHEKRGDAPTHPASLLFHPAWETLPHESKLPHADVISERLETLVALSMWSAAQELTRGAGVDAPLLPLPATQERGEGRGEGESRRKRPSSPQPSPPATGGEGAGGEARPPVQAQTQAQKPTAHFPGVPLVVTSVTALLQRTFRAEEIRQRTRTLKKGDRIDPLDLVEWLEDQGYEPEVQVNHKGEIALRGGIVDLFPLTSPWPVRLEFFGDELESLREFDPISQISREGIESVTIPPGGELGLLKRMVERAAAALQEAERPPHPGPLPLGGGEGARRAGEGTALASFLEYLPANTLIVLCDPPALDEHAATYAEMVPKHDPFFIDWSSIQERMAEAGMTVVTLSDEGVLGEGDSADEPGAVGADASSLPLPATQERGEGKSLRKSASSPQPSPPAAGREGAGATSAGALPQFLSLDAFRPIAERAPEPQVAETQRREFFAQLHRWIRQGHGVHVFCNNDGERERFREIWKEYGLAPISREGGEGSEVPKDTVEFASPPSLPSQTSRETASSQAGLSVHLGALSRGFLCEAAKLVVVTDAEIFGRYKVQRPRRLKSPHAQTSRSLLEIDFTDLQEGDYVVHLEHGIGRYLGLGMMPVASGVKKLEKAAPTPDAQQECLVIEYAAREPDQPAPKLYVPVSEAHLVGKYIGAGKARPPLNTLGGGRWQKTKEHAERAVRDLAGELLSIQAARASQAGHAFKADTTWQREFESSFLYEETPHQWRAINATKGDMEAAKPMDRLICGDVGYGKTEVAIRAAFKAVMDGKQVAILVPTTVLAQQHFNTFRERMADYPVRVELLSRFRTARESRKVIQDLATGAVDIIIGTHRLVQDDIAFKELGLVVIDEEQRFGVMHKEKFKLLRKLVDVLTLSATPIPRTLHLALTGARDMSTIETPPQDRLPVETIVTEFDERVIRDAILRELNRGGQVFYLHNRVLDIEGVASRLRTLVPKARLAVGHGQMHADDLEEVMTNFVNGEADVLLCTTIIESGIDIPNANTIIIDRADRFGLSELYQLRGRVGRYKHQAYAYLLVPRHARLLTDARKRMSAIKQYSSLGSGFKIAMRDLEIRGAGNLLGAQQSGHITAVGFELYCQLLKQSVAALKGEKVKPRVEVQVRLDFLLLNSGDERSEAQGPKPKMKEEEPLNISIPRETATYAATRPEVRSQKPEASRSLTPAGIPLRYVADAKQRIELYRKLAEVMDDEDVNKLKGELRDRFGPLPTAVELLLQVSVLKVLASQRDISVIESKEDKLMLTRRGDFVMVGGRFPRLEKKEARARLNEIRRLLLLIH